MKWYEKKFTDFFDKWKKGDLYLQNGQGYFGEVEGLEFADKFEDSTIKFVCYSPSGEERNVILSEVRHFHASNGPILNISKYVKIVRLGEQSHLSLVEGEKPKGREKSVFHNLTIVDAEYVDGAPGDEEENKVICLVFGLEFYTTEKRARVLQQDAKQILFSGLGNSAPLLSIEEHEPIDLTPTLGKWIMKWIRFLKDRSGKYISKHSAHREQGQTKESSYREKERQRR